MKEKNVKEYLESLNKISKLFTEELEFKTVMYKALVLLSKETGMQRGMISIYRRDLQEIHADITYGIPDKNTAIFYRLGEGITGKVVETGRPIAIPHLDKEPLFLDRSGARQKLKRSELAFICVPITYGNDVVGALSVDRAAERADLKIEVKFLETVSNVLASRVYLRRIKDENIKLKEAVSRHSLKGPIVGNSDAMREIAYLISQVADSDSTVLVTGETGTGKGLIALDLHQRSPRKDMPFIKINCGAIPENLIEMELFGHEKGAFTGAVGKKTGKFEVASGGTIFLDEIGELPLASQVKLLRVLEDKKLERVGGTKTISVNVRVIAATNRNLEDEITAGNFRPDLYYRLNVFPIHVPPLRERGADIILLADYFVRKLSEQLNKKISRIDSSALDMLITYHWPGNVRELQNCIERAILMAKEDVLYGYILPPSLQQCEKSSYSTSKDNFKLLVKSYETSLIIDALKEAKGNQTAATKLLGTTKRIIQYKIKQYGIDYKKYAGKNTVQ
ncbi:Nitrogen fixation protein VnfA [Candidatus Magnetomoraceae bacterium gMMP-15]